MKKEKKKQKKEKKQKKVQVVDLSIVEKFYNEIKDVEYGWYDKQGILHVNIKDENFGKRYKMQKTKDIMKHNHAICWEMCELEREFFKKNKIKHQTIFVYEKDNPNYPCHTFLVFPSNNKWYWFEGSWKEEKGIHEYKSLYEIINYFRNNFSDFSKKYKKDKLKFYRYRKPLRRYGCNGYYRHCMLGKKI